MTAFFALCYRYVIKYIKFGIINKIGKKGTSPNPAKIPISKGRDKCKKKIDL